MGDEFGNPAGTPYELSESTDSTFATAVSTPIPFGKLYGQYYGVHQLNPCAHDLLRSLEVRAENGNSIITPFSLTGSTTTAPRAAAIPESCGRCPEHVEYPMDVVCRDGGKLL